MYNVMGLRKAETAAEAEELLRTFVKDFNGGFHPDDRGAEIMGPGGTPAFDAKNAEHYDNLNMSIWLHLGEDNIYAILDEGRND